MIVWLSEDVDQFPNWLIFVAFILGELYFQSCQVATCGIAAKNSSIINICWQGNLNNISYDSLYYDFVCVLQTSCYHFAFSIYSLYVSVFVNLISSWRELIKVYLISSQLTCCRSDTLRPSSLPHAGCEVHTSRCWLQLIKSVTCYYTCAITKPVTGKSTPRHISALNYFPAPHLIS